MTRDIQINYSSQRGGYKALFRVGPVLLGFITLFFIGVLAFFYLFQTNESVVQGYKIKEFEKKLEDLKKENDELELKAAELQSIEKIQERTGKLNMVKITNASYITFVKEELALEKR